MEEQVYSISELLELYLFLGSITFLVGVIIQITLLKRKGCGWSKIFVYITLSQLLCFAIGKLLWLYLNLPIDGLQGIVFLPVAIPEFIFAGLFYFLVDSRLE